MSKESKYPDKCPITNLPIFTEINHPKLGMVPTYGGPSDSYTIPEIDEEGDFFCYRYDHDEGCWVDGEECIGNAIDIITELHAKAATLGMNLRGVEKARNQYYDDMCNYKDACTDLIKYRDTLYTAIKKRDAYITTLTKALLDHCVTKCKNTKRPFNCDYEECTTYRALLSGPTEAYELEQQRKGAGHCE